MPVFWANFGIFSARSKWFHFGSDLWPWKKPGYITMMRRQSNNQWSGGIVAHPARKKSERKIPLEKFSPQFFGVKMASSSLIIFQRANLSTQSITNLCWWNWRTFWRKNAAASSLRGFCSCTTMPRLTGHLQPRRNWPTWLPKSWSPTLFSGSVSVRLPPVPWTEKKWKFAIFRPRRGHCCRGDLVGRSLLKVLRKWRFKLGRNGGSIGKKLLTFRWSFLPALSGSM